MPTKKRQADTGLTASESSLSAPDHSARRRVMRVLRQTAEELERELLSFDVDQDTASIIPMPRTIAADLQAAITLALSRRFEFYDDELDAWLHAPNDALDGASPFDRVMDGDGVAVLLALADQPPNAQATPVFDATPQRHLNIVR